MENDEVKVDVPGEVVECETESFEDLGPSVSLQVKESEPIESVTPIPEPNIEPSPEPRSSEPTIEPPTTNITAVDVTNPYLTSTGGEMVQRKKAPEDEKYSEKYFQIVI